MLKEIKFETILKDEDRNRLKKIIQDIKIHPVSFCFLEPVNYMELGLKNYIEIIQRPMDISTIMSKLENNKYDYVVEVIDDIQLIWDNCKTYNTEGSEIYEYAQTMEKYCDEIIGRYYKFSKRSKFTVSSDSFLKYMISNYRDVSLFDPPMDEVSLKDKIEMNKMIKNLDQNRLKIVNKIES
jgi:hypothetical protein